MKRFLLLLSTLLLGFSANAQMLWIDSYYGNMLSPAWSNEKSQKKLIDLCDKRMKKDPELESVCWLYKGLAFSPNVLYSRLWDLEKSKEYLEKAESIMDATDTTLCKDVYYNLGLVYYHDWAGGDLDKAIDYFEKASDLDIKCSNVLGQMYQFGIGVDAEPALALEYYQDCAHGGGDSYANLYAMMYVMEKIAEGNLDEAAYAKYRDAIILESRGEGTIYCETEDKENVLAYLKEAAEAEFVPAMFELGAYLACNPRMCEESEWLEGLDWLLKAAEKNYPPAMHMLGYATENLYHRVAFKVPSIDRRLEPNTAEAIPFYKKAAAAGFPPSQCAVGLYYFNNGDYASASYWYGEAASVGYARAQTLLDNFDAKVEAIQKAQLEAAIQNLSNAVAGFGQSLASACEVFSNNYETAQPAIEKVGYSKSLNESTKEAKSLTSKASQLDGQKLLNKHIEEKAYDGYCNLLSKMKYGYYQYDDKKRKEIQQSMKEIRTKWTSQGYDFYQNSYENWDGNDRK